MMFLVAYQIKQVFSAQNNFQHNFRNPVKELLLSRLPPGSPQIYYGPDECIDDHIEAKYFDNPMVKI